MGPSYRILICDDHAIFRQGLLAVIADNPALEVVGEAATGLEALQMVKKLTPDMVVMDITMPEMSGIDATKEVLKISPETRVVILSVHSRKTFIMESLKAGARGYVLKDSAGEKLLEAVEAVLKGGCYLDSPIAAHIVDEFIMMPEKDLSPEPPGERLSDRERQILRLIVEGLTNRQIAEKLYLSPKTVENHRSNIMRKLGRHDVIALAKYAISSGLIDPEAWSR